MALVSVGLDIKQMQKEKEQEQKMAEVRRDITSQFQSLAKDLENQIELQLWEVEKQVYGEIENQIAAARQQEESAIAASNIWVKKLADIRKDFDLILRYITKATENPVI